MRSKRVFVVFPLLVLCIFSCAPSKEEQVKNYHDSITLETNNIIQKSTQFNNSVYNKVKKELTPKIMKNPNGTVYLEPSTLEYIKSSSDQLLVELKKSQQKIKSIGMVEFDEGLHESGLRLSQSSIELFESNVPFFINALSDGVDPDEVDTLITKLNTLVSQGNKFKNEYKSAEDIYTKKNDSSSIQ